MLTINDLILYIQNQYNINVILNYTEEEINCGWAASNTIYVSKYDDEDIALAIILHELGHCLNNYDTMSTLSNEAIAWETGLKIARELGYKWGYNSKQYVFARKCLASYIGGEYDDIIQYSPLYEHTLRYKMDNFNTNIDNEISFYTYINIVYKSINIKDLIENYTIYKVNDITVILVDKCIVEIIIDNITNRIHLSNFKVSFDAVYNPIYFVEKLILKIENYTK